MKRYELANTDPVTPRTTRAGMAASLELKPLEMKALDMKDLDATKALDVNHLEVKPPATKSRRLTRESNHQQYPSTHHATISYAYNLSYRTRFLPSLENISNASIVPSFHAYF